MNQVQTNVKFLKYAKVSIGSFNILPAVNLFVIMAIGINDIIKAIVAY